MTQADVHVVEILGTGQRFAVAEGERILSAARNAGIWLPFECGWGSCGTCKVTLVDGTTQLLFPAAPAVSERDARRNRILACQSTALSDLVIKATGADTPQRQELHSAAYPATVLQSSEIGPDIWCLRFGVATKVDFREGQHAIFDLGDGLRRCYSMSNTSNEQGIVEFVAKRYPGGPGSGTFTGLLPGATVSVELPFGDMWIRDSATRICLVAGGTGIAPILSMLRRLALRGDDRVVHVFYGANTVADLVYWDELTAVVAGLANAHLVGAVATAPMGWTETEGFVTGALADRLGELESADFYAAGPPVMTDAVVSLLGDHGVSIDRIHYDSFG